MSRRTWTAPGGPGGASPQIGQGTMILLGLIVVPFLLAWFGLGPNMMRWLALMPSESLIRPWSILTYPLADPGNGGAFISVVFTALWGYFMGSTLERDLRGWMLVGVYALLAVIGGLSLTLGGLMLAPSLMMYGTFIPLAGLTVLWATRNPESTVMLMMIIPVKAKWIGFVSAGAVLFTTGTGAPLLGLFGLLPLVAAFLYATNRIPGIRYGKDIREVKVTKKKAAEHNEFIDNVRKREIEREEKEKLRRLFEASMKDDPNDKR